MMRCVIDSSYFLRLTVYFIAHSFIFTTLKKPTKHLTYKPTNDPTDAPVDETMDVSLRFFLLGFTIYNSHLNN